MNADFSEFEDVVELIESLEVEPGAQVRAAHIRLATEASSVFLLQRLGIAGVPLTRILARAAAVLLVLGVSVSALGAAAALPEPLQNVVVSMAGYFGIDLPSDDGGSSESGLLPPADDESLTIEPGPTVPEVEEVAEKGDGSSVACEDDESSDDSDECDGDKDDDDEARKNENDDESDKDDDEDDHDDGDEDDDQDDEGDDESDGEDDD